MPSSVVKLISLLIAMAANCVNSVPYGFGNAGRQEDAVIVDATPSFSPVASDPSYPVHSPGMFCRHRIYYNPSGSETKQNYQQREQTTYQTYQPYQPSPEFPRMRGNGNTYQYPSHTTNYETYRTPSTTVESSQYFRQQNNEIQDNSHNSKACNQSFASKTTNGPRAVVNYKSLVFSIYH